MCSEAHTLSLIMFVLKGFREGAETLEMAEIKWDAATMLDNAEFWLGTRAVLSGKILPMGERDVALYKEKVSKSNNCTVLLPKQILMNLYRFPDLTQINWRRAY